MKRKQVWWLRAPRAMLMQLRGVMRAAFSCDRGGLGGVADSDYIRMQPFEAIEEVLQYRFPDCRSDDCKKASGFLGELDSLKGADHRRYPRIRDW